MSGHPIFLVLVLLFLSFSFAYSCHTALCTSLERLGKKASQAADFPKTSVASWEKLRASGGRKRGSTDSRSIPLMTQRLPHVILPPPLEEPCLSSLDLRRKSPYDVAYRVESKLFVESRKTLASFNCWQLNFRTDVCSVSDHPSDALSWIRQMVQQGRKDRMIFHIAAVDARAVVEDETEKRPSGGFTKALE